MSCRAGGWGRRTPCSAEPRRRRAAGCCSPTPTCASRRARCGVSLAYALDRALDHLVVLPRLEARGALLASFVAAFGLLFSVYTRPWRARDPRSRASIGIGAFALLRADAYRRAGGHAAIRLRPDDDVALGRLVKGAGLRQEAVFGAEDVVVEWYPDLGSALRGLNKNAFAGLGYSTLRLSVVVLALLVTNVLPFLALPLVGGVHARRLRAGGGHRRVRLRLRCSATAAQPLAVRAPPRGRGVAGLRRRGVGGQGAAPRSDRVARHALRPRRVAPRPTPVTGGAARGRTGAGAARGGARRGRRRAPTYTAPCPTPVEGRARQRVLRLLAALLLVGRTRRARGRRPRRPRTPRRRSVRGSCARALRPAGGGGGREPSCCASPHCSDGRRSPSASGCRAATTSSTPSRCRCRGRT